MFKSIGGFFRDIVAPIGLSFMGPAGPLLAAAYSGINTGIKTGSPLAGLGSAGLSFGLSSAFRGITDKVASKTFEPVFKTAAEGSINTATGEIVGSSAANIAARAPSIIGGEIVSNVPGGILGTATPEIGLYAAKPMAPGIGGLFQGAKDTFTTPVSQLLPGSPTDVLPEFVTRQTPLTIAGAGLALKTVATPPPEPAPFAPMQGQSRTIDMSKYGYKGPLVRGDYTYADPEDIAYGRVTPGSYGYLGAKEGGTIKLQSGGVGSGMMQAGPYNPAIERQKGTFRPTGSMVSPTAAPGISSIYNTQPMMSVSKARMAGLAQPVAPTIPTTNVPMAQPQAPAPMPIPQPQQQKGGIEEQAQQLINDLPQKDINVNIDQIRQFIGLAEGGKVPTTEKEFARLGVYKRPEDYDTKEMAEGGAVESDQMLQSNAFVIPADVVGHIGDGSSDAGAQRLQSYLGMNPQQYQAGGIMAGELQGPGGGMDDLIQTSIEGKRAAAVSPQEFVVPRDIVAELGQGSYDKGSNKLYALMRNVRKAKTGTTKQPAELTRGLGQLMRTAVA